MLHKYHLGIISAVSLGLLAIPVSAHHGSNGQFDMATDLSVSGVFTQIKYVNPHGYIYFDVTDEAGAVQNWRCELSSGSIMKRRGWTPELFTKGAKITIDGNPAWKEPHGCRMTTLTFEDGGVLGRNADLTKDGLAAVNTAPRALTLADGTPNIFGNWNTPPRIRAPAPAGGEGMAPQAMGGGGMGGPPAFVDVTPSAAGKAANAGWSIEDLPRLHCKPVNIFHDWWFDGHVNTIAQDGDAITMTYGFMDIVRTIHMDMKSHPDDITPSRAGHSIGHWDGNALVIETAGFDEGYILDIPGVKHSAQLTTTERLYLSEDGKTLVRDYGGSDPLYLEGDFTSSDKMVASNAQFDPYECDDLTQEVVGGGFEYTGGDTAAPVPTNASAMGAGPQAGATATSGGMASWLKILMGALLAGLVGFVAMRKKKT